MGSSCALVCAVASMLVSSSSACKDGEACLQGERTDFRGQEMVEPDLSMLQREVDLTDLLNLDDFFTQQVIVKPPGQIGLSEPGGQPSFRPRSFPPAESYPVQFPLGRPTSDNIQAICVHADHRPRYPPSYFPPSYFSKQKRMAAAVNNAESWFRTCCKGNQTWGTEGMSCCAIQAWQRSVESFCEEDSSVKDRLYPCCRKTDVNRLNCFNKDAPNPNYEPSEESPVDDVDPAEKFIFNRSHCPRNSMSPPSPRANRKKTELNPATSQKIVSFPPGRPTAANIDSSCGNQRLRPLYTTKCSPRSGYESSAQQVKTINRSEKRFKQCCKRKKGVLGCAESKWREELNKYCLATNSGQVELPCCQADDSYGCFQSVSSDPLYNITAAAEEPTLNKMCDTQSINNRFPVSFQSKTLCCPSPEEERSTCFAQKLEQTSQSLCSSNKSHNQAVRRCCKMTSREETTQCFSKNVVEAIAKATKKGQKKKKICPIP